MLCEGWCRGAVRAYPSEMVFWVLANGLLVMWDYLGILIFMALLNIPYLGVRVTRFSLFCVIFLHRALSSHFYLPTFFCLHILSFFF